MSGAILGKGTLLQYETTPGSGTWVTLAELRSIDGPTNQADEVEVSNHDTAGDYKEFINGLIDAGQIQCAGNLIPDNSSQNQAITDQKSRTSRTWRIRWAQMASPWGISFSAVVQQFSFTNPVASQLEFNLTLRLSGAITGPVAMP